MRYCTGIQPQADSDANSGVAISCPSGCANALKEVRGPWLVHHRLHGHLVSIVETWTKMLWEAWLPICTSPAVHTMFHWCC